MCSTRDKSNFFLLTRIAVPPVLGEEERENQPHASDGCSWEEKPPHSFNHSLALLSESQWVSESRKKLTSACSERRRCQSLRRLLGSCRPLQLTANDLKKVGDCQMRNWRWTQSHCRQSWSLQQTPTQDHVEQQQLWVAAAPSLCYLYSCYPFFPLLIFFLGFRCHSPPPLPPSPPLSPLHSYPPLSPLLPPLPHLSLPPRPHLPPSSTFPPLPPLTNNQ